MMQQFHQEIFLDGKKVNNPEFTIWQNNDGLLMPWLRGMMNEDIMTIIVGCLSTRDIWLFVEEHMLLQLKNNNFG